VDSRADCVCFCSTSVGSMSKRWDCMPAIRLEMGIVSFGTSVLSSSHADCSGGRWEDQKASSTSSSRCLSRLFARRLRCFSSMPLCYVVHEFQMLCSLAEAYARLSHSFDPLIDFPAADVFLFLPPLLLLPTERSPTNFTALRIIIAHFVERLVFLTSLAHPLYYLPWLLRHLISSLLLSFSTHLIAPSPPPLLHNVLIAAGVDLRLPYRQYRTLPVLRR
jgi:hypothetical protein